MQIREQLHEQINKMNIGQLLNAQKILGIFEQKYQVDIKRRYSIDKESYARKILSNLSGSLSEDILSFRNDQI